MMIGSVLSAVGWISQLAQSGGSNAGVAARGDVEATAPAGSPPGGAMADAMTQALATVGVGNNVSSSSKTLAASASSSASSTQDPTQALASFMQCLTAALHAQSHQASLIDAGGDRSSSGLAELDAAGHPRHKTDVQSLLEKLSSASSVSSAAGSIDASVGALQQSFQNLLGAVGGGNTNATLAGFLQALAGNLQGVSSVGNVVSTQV